MPPLNLNLTAAEAEALERQLDRATDPDLEGVRDKLARLTGPRVPDVIPGQTTIDDHLEAA